MIDLGDVGDPRIRATHSRYAVVQLLPTHDDAGDERFVRAGERAVGAVTASRVSPAPPSHAAP